MKTLFPAACLALAMMAGCSQGDDAAPAPAPTPAETEMPSNTAGDPETMPEAPGSERVDRDAEQVSCADEIGEAEAQILVDQCINMSPATHPPCNVQNSCDMIRGEIARGCAFGDTSGNPDYCDEYN